MTKTVSLLLLFLCTAASAQISYDKVVVTKHTFIKLLNLTDSEETDSLYKTSVKTIRDSKTIKELSDAINERGAKSLLTMFGIDTNLVKNHADKLLAYSEETRIDWNAAQTAFITAELGNLKNYETKLIDYLREGCCYSMHKWYASQISLAFYSKGKALKVLNSRKYVYGFQMPWTTSDAQHSLYNFEIEKIIRKELKDSQNPELLKGEELLRYLVNEIIKDNIKTLFKLSASSYSSEIDKLKTKFEVLSAEEVYSQGRYLLSSGPTINVTLHNGEMLPNVYLQFMASVDNGKLYTTDSIRANYQKIVTRVQSIAFISQYLKKHPKSKIDIYYFDSKAMNEYTIDNVNKNPLEWKKQDEYVESFKWYKEHNVKLSFDEAEAIKISQKNHCGCNYRYEKNFIGNGIFFEFFDEDGNSSIWILMPDDSVLLYILSGSTVADFPLPEFVNAHGTTFPCLLFDTFGNRIIKTSDGRR